MKPTYEELELRVAELEVRNRLLESVINQSPVAVLITDPIGVIEFVNENYFRILGHTPEEMTDEFIHSILQGEESVALYEEMKKSIMAGTLWKGVLTEKRKDGRVVWLNHLVFPVLVDSEIKHYAIIISDITQQRADNELKFKQDALYKSLIENLPLLISIYDLNGTFLYANELTDSFFHMKKGAITGKNYRELFPAEAAYEQYKNLQQIIETGKSTTVSRSFRMHGKINHFTSTHQPIFNERGELTSVLVIGQNVTAQEQHANLLRIQHNIDSLSNQTASLTSSLKKAFTYLKELDWINVGGIYLFDDDRKHLRLIFSEGLSEDYLKAVSVYSNDSPQTKLILKGKPRFANTRVFLKPISNIMLKEKLTFVVAIPLIYKKDVIGSLNLGSKIVEDIDSQDRLIIESIASRLANLIILVRTREELLASNLQLKKSLKANQEKQQMLIQKSRLESLGELSAGLAHEINQPLSVISLVMENINYKLDQNAASIEYLTGKFQTIIQNINKIRLLIDHVRIFSRDQGTIMFERVNVNQVILDALSMIQSQLISRQINVITNLSDDTGYTVGNPSRIEQVILNMLSNSRDALEEKEKKSIQENYSKEIRITTICEKSMILVKVRDNGIGISSENLGKIFNPFFTTKINDQGTGLGLPIVYGIVKEMQGEINASSIENEFTEITITLPYYKKNIEKL